MWESFIKEIEFQIRLLLKRAWRPKVDVYVDTDVIGNIRDGAWGICVNLVDAHSIIYSVGIGLDISWDKGLIEKYGVKILAFDPTPGSIKWLKNQELPSSFFHSPYALGWENGLVKFYIEGSNTPGCSMVKGNGQTETISVKCYTLRSLMQQMGHNKIDVLKIDIEGAEYEVLRNILDENIEIGQLLVEYHHRSKGDFKIDDTRHVHNMLQKAGYKVFWRSPRGREVGYVKEYWL